MNASSNALAVFPGTFDPFTNGHLDVIERGARIFARIVVGVGHNPEKTSMFDQDERTRMAAEIVSGMDNVSVEAFGGLTVDFVRRCRADVILRGIRSSSDLQFEFQVALTNRVVAGVETVFIMTRPEFAFISSSLTRQMASMGADVSALVPKTVLAHIRRKAGKQG
jgi:pantetheine-phosphate adenylyltransferase